jgi:hypothetical protein
VTKEANRKIDDLHVTQLLAKRILDRKHMRLVADINIFCGVVMEMNNFNHDLLCSRVYIMCTCNRNLCPLFLDDPHKNNKQHRFRDKYGKSNRP